jgi:predicted protein tyrosine phosphatase
VITLSDETWATAAIAGMEANYLVSLMSPQSMAGTPSSIASSNHLQLAVDDIESGLFGYVCPTEQHVSELLGFGKQVADEAEVVVHCSMGMSRSPAAVMILLVQRNPGKEAEISALLFNEAPKVKPNRLLLNIADRLLGCGGALVRAGCIQPHPSCGEGPVYRGSLGSFITFPWSVA